MPQVILVLFFLVLVQSLSVHIMLSIYQQYQCYFQRTQNVMYFASRGACVHKSRWKQIS